MLTRSLRQSPQQGGRGGRRRQYFEYVEHEVTGEAFLGRVRSPEHPLLRDAAPRQLSAPGIRREFCGAPFSRIASFRVSNLLVGFVKVSRLFFCTCATSHRWENECSRPWSLIFSSSPSSWRIVREMKRVVFAGKGAKNGRSDLRLIEVDEQRWPYRCLIALRITSENTQRT